MLLLPMFSYCVRYIPIYADCRCRLQELSVILLPAAHRSCKTPCQPCLTACDQIYAYTMRVWTSIKTISWAYWLCPMKALQQGTAWSLKHAWLLVCPWLQQLAAATRKTTHISSRGTCTCTEQLQNACHALQT